MVIDQEIREITEAGAADRGERLNAIADQFRRGRDVNDLIVLLDSGDHELVSIGAWILGELRFELYNVAPIISRLQILVEHKDAAVRFHAFGALYPALRWQDVATQSLLRKLRNDPNQGVRRSAEAATARLSQK
jgi:HEAT repeat protein